MLVRVGGVLLAFFVCNAAFGAKCTESGANSFLSRVVAIDPGSGLVYRPAKDISGVPPTPSPLELHDKEVVLTFEQGPHSAYTTYILDVLDHRCVKATFFFTGSAAFSRPGEVRDTARRGHTIAAAPWSSSADFLTLSLEASRAEIEKSFTVIANEAGGTVAPFFRAPSAAVPATVSAYLKERNVILWYPDIVSGDTEPGLTATQLANRTLLRVQEAGKGVIQFHDTKKVTVDALDSILYGLQLGGFKVVHIVAASNLVPKEEYSTGGIAKSVRLTTSPTAHKLLGEAKRRTHSRESDRPEDRRSSRKKETSE